MLISNRKLIFKNLCSIFLLGALTACGSSEKTSELLQSVTLGLDGSYQLVGTSCSDGSKPVNFNQIEQIAFSKLDHEMTRFCRLELDPIQDELIRLSAQKSEFSSRLREIEVEHSRLSAEFTDLNNRIEKVQLKEELEFQRDTGLMEAKLVLLESGIRELEAERQEKVLLLEVLDYQLEQVRKSLSAFVQSFRDDFQCKIQENLPGAGEILKLFRDSLYHDFAIPQVLAGQLISADGEGKKDFIPQSLWRVVLPQLELVRRSVERGSPSLVTFHSKSQGFSNSQQPIDSSTEPEEKKYLESGKQTDQDLQSVSERDSLEIRYEIENGTLWTVYENKANQCVQRFPSEVELRSENSIEIFPSLDLLATCSDSCGRLENELCDRFSANVKSQYSEKQKRSLSLEEARSILYPDSSIRFQYSKETENLLLTRVTRDSGDPLAIVSTKKLRLEIDQNSACTDSANTSFVLRRLQDSSSRDKIE